MKMHVAEQFVMKLFVQHSSLFEQIAGLFTRASWVIGQ